MDIKTRLKRHLHEHRHLASGFLAGMTLVLLAVGFTGSDAQVPVPRGVKVSGRVPVVATITGPSELLKPAAQDEPEAEQGTAIEPHSEPASSEAADPSSSASSASPVRIVVPASSTSSLAPALPAVADPSPDKPETPAPQPSSAASSSAGDSEQSTSAPSSASSAVPDDAPDFPPFQRTVFPVSRTPDWGSMRTPSEWNRSFSEMQESDFVRIPRYDLKAFTVPMKDLADPITDDTIPLITQKLFYSTRFFGAYDLDAGEFSAVHPGIDLKLARGTPVGAIGGGRVSTVASSQSLGLHVIIEHRLKNGETYYSVYGHFDSVSVAAGQDVTPGQTIGRVGTTGNTSGPHIHLQVDRGQPGASHVPYRPASLPSRSEAARYTVNPVVFIAEHSGGDH